MFANRLETVLYQEQPGADPVVLSIPEFQQKFNFIYSEVVTDDTDSRPDEKQRNDAENALIFSQTVAKRIKERLENPLPYLAVCKLDEKIGCGLITTQPIPAGTLLFLYAGKIKYLPYNQTHDYYIGSEYGARIKGDIFIDPKEVGGLARFMQHAPTENKVDEEFDFVDPETRKKLAIANVNLIATIYQGIPCLIAETCENVEAGHGLYFDYGRPYWALRNAYPELFEKKGGILPRKFYSRKIITFPLIDSDEKGLIAFEFSKYDENNIEMLDLIKHNKIEILGVQFSAIEFRELLISANAIDESYSEIKNHELIHKLETCSIIKNKSSALKAYYHVTSVPQKEEERSIFIIYNYPDIKNANDFINFIFSALNLSGNNMMEWIKWSMVVDKDADMISFCLNKHEITQFLAFLVEHDETPK